MKHIYKTVYNHMSTNTTGALIVTGKLGSGKTYFFNNFLFPNLSLEVGMALNRKRSMTYTAIDARIAPRINSRLAERVPCDVSWYRLVYSSKHLDDL